MPELPDDVIDYLRDRALVEDDLLARSLLSSYDESPAGPQPGDVLWDDGRAEALIWDEAGSGRTGWWSAKEGDFVEPGEERTNLVLHGQLVHAVFGRQPDPQTEEMLEAARQLYSAVEWLLLRYTVAEKLTNARTGATFLSAVPDLADVNAVMVAWEKALEQAEDEPAPEPFS